MTIFDLDGIEKASIRHFLESVAWEGAVLDYGCGQQPYRQLIEDAGGEYAAYDRKDFGGNVSKIDLGDARLLDQKWDYVVSTQTLQYVPDVPSWLAFVKPMVADRGLLVLTYPSTWPVLRDELWHFTQAGMELLLRTAGFSVLRHEIRAVIPMDGFELPVGYGVVARA